jgi:hypothetical protein
VGVLVADAVLFLTVGIAMWREAPTPAEEAVGKGLFVLGVALALPAVVGFFAWLELRPDESPNLPPTRSDWDPV